MRGKEKENAHTPLVTTGMSTARPPLTAQPSPAQLPRAHRLAPDSALTNAALAAAAGQGPLSLSHGSIFLTARTGEQPECPSTDG